MDSSYVMSINSERLEVTGTRVELLPWNYSWSANTILIGVEDEVYELIEDQNGMITYLGSYSAPQVSPIELKTRDLTPRYISQLLHQLIGNTDHCQILGERIAFECVYLPRPFVLYVNVKLTRVVLFMLPFVSVPSRGASVDVLQRLLEEQRVDLKDEKEATCSICLEDLLSESSSESHENIIRLPDCLHSFHKGCIFEWLKHQNSCPLCRSVPYEKDQETE